MSKGERVPYRRAWALVENGVKVMVQLDKESKYPFIGPKKAAPDHREFVLAECYLDMPNVEDEEGRSRKAVCL